MWKPYYMKAQICIILIVDIQKVVGSNPTYCFFPVFFFLQINAMAINWLPACNELIHIHVIISGRAQGGLREGYFYHQCMCKEFNCLAILQLCHSVILQRIRSNFAGLKKGGDSPKHQRSVIPSNVINNFDDSAQMRSRVTSISGKAMRSKGMGITFGDSSSGEHMVY